MSISPMLGVGSSGPVAGINTQFGGKIGDFDFELSGGLGKQGGIGDLTGKASPSIFYNWGAKAGATVNHTYYGGSYASNKFTKSNHNQGVGAVGLQIGDFGFRLDEDFIWDGGDRYRTGGFLATYKVNNDLTYVIGGAMITGQADVSAPRTFGGNPLSDDFHMMGTYQAKYETNAFRGGILYGGTVYKGVASFYGNNSEDRLHVLQNWIHHNLVNTAYFEDLGRGSAPYNYNGTFNGNYLYY